MEESKAPKQLENDANLHEEIAHHESSTRFVSAEHRLYVFERHGTLDLDPMPSQDPADPYNWRMSKASISICNSFSGS